MPAGLHARSKREYETNDEDETYEKFLNIVCFVFFRLFRCFF
jgi:hypothetical protein